MQLPVFALRHVATGRFMPARMYRTSGAGWSYWNPHETREGWKPHDENPRIFFTHQSAKNAAAMWTAGEWKRHRGTSYSFDGVDNFDYLEVKTPEAPRRRGDLEVVALMLVDSFSA